MKLYISNFKIRELIENIYGVSNTSNFIISIRLILRILLNFPIKSISMLFFIFLKFFTPIWFLSNKIKNKTLYYSVYLIHLNYFKFLYYYYFSNKNYLRGLYYKNEMVNFVNKFSLSYKDRRNAKIYKYFLNKYNNNILKDDLTITDNSSYSNISKKEKFFILGPNSKLEINAIKSDYKLIMTKHFNLDLSKFKNKAIFINSITYKKYLQDDKLSELLELYEKIYVNERDRNLGLNKCIRIKNIAQGNLSSLMGLQRILYNLLIEHGPFECVIEGFDLYLEEKMYSDYHTPSNKEKNAKLYERHYCESLLSHDAVYNFLFLKELLLYINIEGNEKVLNILSMSLSEYLKKLNDVRRFEYL